MIGEAICSDAINDRYLDRRYFDLNAESGAPINVRLTRHGEAANSDVMTFAVATVSRRSDR